MFYNLSIDELNKICKPLQNARAVFILKNEVEQWLNELYIPFFDWDYYPSIKTIRFDREEDFIAFKLRWL